MKQQPTFETSVTSEARVAGPRFVLALLAVAGTLTASGCDAPGRAGPAAAVDPRALYGQNCARCHGADGRGDPEMKKSMPTIRDFSDPTFRAMSHEQMEQVIMAGRNLMPGFGAALSRPKVQHLGGYARRLGEAAARADGKAPVQAPPPVAAPPPGY